jgi:beta-lactamase class A
MIQRRAFLLGTLAAAANPSFPSASASASAAAAAAAPATAAAASKLALLERQAGVRLGVAAINTASGARLSWRAQERFAMCSTFKWMLAALILDRVSRGALSLDRRITYGPADLLDFYAPVTRAHLDQGWLTVGDLCAAAIEDSDNGAANLLLEQVGGPAGLTRYIRHNGDRVTRLDRSEPELNNHMPGDPRDTTTPAAMVLTMRRLLLGNALSQPNRATLIGWMERTSTGHDRLRAGLPAGWRVGDKTGTGSAGEANDLAIAWPPGKKAILIASYLDGGTADAGARNAVHAKVARAIVAAWS